MPPVPNPHGFHSSHHEEKISSHAYIAELCDGVRTVGEEWIRRLAVSTEARRLNPGFYTRVMFELGIRTIREYFRGATPSRFQDIFAMTHVVIASSSIVGDGNDGSSWNLIVEEACQWKDLISDSTERDIFAKAMRQLYRPLGSTDLSPLHGSTFDDNLSSAELAKLDHLISHLCSTAGRPRIYEVRDDSRQITTTDGERNRLSGTQQRSVPTKGFTDFLDNFAHAVIIEDLANRQTYAPKYVQEHASGIKTLERDIIRRLGEWEGLESFRGVVTETQHMLQYGLLHTVRDVEVVLLWSGKSRSKSHQLLPKYVSVVNHLCDEVMKEWGLDWRDSFYEAILGTVIATASELSHARGAPIQNTSIMPFDNVGRHLSSAPTASSASQPLSKPDSPTTTTTSPPDPGQPSSAHPSEDISYCPDPSCKASFKGASHKSNLNRHLRSVLHHNQDALFRCDFCKSAFGRSDNLQQHLRNVHGVDPAFQAFSPRTPR